MKPLSFLLCFSVIALLLTSCNGCGKSHAPDMEQQLAAYKDSTTHWKNKYNEAIASRPVVVGTNEQVGKFYNLDSIAAHFDTKAKRLEGYLSVISKEVSQLKASGDPKIVYRDRDIYHASECPEVSYMTQDFRNPYYNLSVRVGDSAYANLTAIDTLTVAQYRGYRRGFFAKQWFTTISIRNANPAVRNEITGAFEVKDRERTNYLDLKGQTGATNLSEARLKVFAGVEAEYNRGKMSVFGSYNSTFLGTQKEFIITGVRYRLLRL